MLNGIEDIFSVPRLQHPRVPARPKIRRTEVPGDIESAGNLVNYCDNCPANHEAKSALPACSRTSSWDGAPL